MTAAGAVTAARSPRSVAAVLVERAGGRVLFAQRAGAGDMCGLWELPGGKVEAGESDIACLVREMQEELCLRIGVRRAMAETTFTHAGRARSVTAYLVVARGVPRIGEEHRRFAWLTPADALLRLRLVPSDRRLLECLPACCRLRPAPRQRRFATYDY